MTGVFQGTSCVH